MSDEINEKNDSILKVFRDEVEPVSDGSQFTHFNMTLLSCIGKKHLIVGVRFWSKRKGNIA